MMFRFLFLVLIFFSILSCDEKPVANESMQSKIESSIVYDSLLAKQLDANDFGLKTYTLCFFDRGKQAVMKAEELMELEKEHIDYMQNLIEKKEIVMAGYFDGKAKHLGLVVFNSLDTSYIKSLIEKDPKVEKGIIVPSFAKWTSSAAIQQLNSIHLRIQKEEMN